MVIDIGVCSVICLLSVNATTGAKGVSDSELTPGVTLLPDDIATPGAWSVTNNEPVVNVTDLLSDTMTVGAL